MKKMIGVVLATVMFSLVLSATTSFAGVCGTMSVVSVSSDESIPSGSRVWLQNETSATCAGIPPGYKGLFSLPPNTSDKAMALILTAISLNKNMWVASSSDPIGCDNGTKECGNGANAAGMISILSMQN